MTESSNNQIDESCRIELTVCQLQNFKNEKVEKCEINVRVSFGDQIIKEFTKILIQDEFANVNLQCQLQFPSNDFALDDLLKKPLNISVSEITSAATSGKEKKSKNVENLVLLANCYIDLIPLITGNMRFREVIVFNIPAGSPYELITPGNPKPSLEFEACRGKDMMGDADSEDANIINITVESLFSPPETWLANGQNYTYIAAMKMPRSSEKENLLAFCDGQYLRPQVDSNIHNNRKKWPMANQEGIYFGDQLISNDAFCDESGELRSSDDYDFRKESLQNKPRSTWNIQQRSFLDIAANKILKDKICENRYWPIQIFRTAQKDAKPVKGKATQTQSEDEVGFHGVAYIDMSPLLYPGASKFRGAFKVYPFYENEVTNKTNKVAKSLTEPTMQQLSGFESNQTPVVVKTPKKDEAKPTVKAEKDKKQKTSKQSAPKETASETGKDAVNEEGMQYEQAVSYLLLEINLLRPLVPRRDVEQLTEKISEMILSKDKLPKKTNNAQKSVADFGEQICQISNQLFQDYISKFSQEIVTNIPKDEFYEQQRQELIYELNASGKYLVFKERLKHSIIKIVREKYLKTKNFQDRTEFQVFLADLYVFLIDEMHSAIRQFVSKEVKEKDVASPATVADLKLFACEAESNSDYQLAARFYKERIAQNKLEPDFWIDFGVHLLYLAQFEKAEECFKEALSINQSHINSLLMMGLVNALQGRANSAELFLETCTQLQSNDINAWVILGLFYSYVGNEVLCEMALDKAHRLNMASCQQQQQQQQQANVSKNPVKPIETEPRQPSPIKVSSPSPIKNIPKSKGKIKELEEVPPIASPRANLFVSESIFLPTIKFLLEHSATQFAEIALASYLLDKAGGATFDYYMCLARVHVHKRELDEAEDCVHQAINLQVLNSNAWALYGHIQLLKGEIDAAMSSYERCLLLEGEPEDLHIVRVKLGSIYLNKLKFADAKNTFLQACKKTPTCLSWLGVGISCYRLCELVDAEDALMEANRLDKMNSQAWAYLCLISLQQSRRVEAEQAYKYAMQLDLQDGELLKEIQDLQEMRGFGNPEL